jgi:hypothetical protein
VVRRQKKNKAGVTLGICTRPHRLVRAIFIIIIILLPNESSPLFAHHLFFHLNLNTHLAIQLEQFLVADNTVCSKR